MRKMLTGLLVGSAFLSVMARASEGPDKTLGEKVQKVWTQHNAGRTAPEQKAPEQEAPEAKAPEAKAPEQKAPEQKAPEANAPEQKAPEIKAFTPEELFKATSWDEASTQSFLLDAILNNNLDINPSLTHALRLMPMDFREGLLRGAAAFAKAFAQSPVFPEEYLKRRKDLWGYEPAQEDPNVPIAAKDLVEIRLRAFLAETADIDFDAKVELKWSRVYFADEKYEAKPPLWKKCFRLGPRLTQVARELAAAWLAELEPPKQP